MGIFTEQEDALIRRVVGFFRRFVAFLVLELQFLVEEWFFVEDLKLVEEVQFVGCSLKQGSCSLLLEELFC